MKKILFFFTVISLSSYANVHYSFDARYRSQPSGYNVHGSINYDGLLHGVHDKTKPFYGYYRLGAKIGGSPTGAVYLQVAPIAPLIFEVQKGASYRFLQSSSFNCKNVYCFGVVDRTDYIVRLLAGYKKFVFSLSHMYREINTPNSSTPVGLELEYFTVSPGFHRYNETALLAAYKLEDNRTIGLTYSSNKISEGDRSSSALYGIYRWKMHDFDWTAGVGNMSSDQSNVGGAGVLFMLGRKFGDGLSLL